MGIRDRDDSADRPERRPAWLVSLAAGLVGAGASPRLALCLCDALADLELDEAPATPAVYAWRDPHGVAAQVKFLQGRRSVALLAERDGGSIRLSLVERNWSGRARRVPFGRAGRGLRDPAALRAAFARTFQAAYPLSEMSDEVAPEGRRDG